MYVLLYLLKALQHMAALLLNGSGSQVTTLMCAPPTPTHRQACIVCLLHTSSACYCLLPPSPPSPGKRAKFDANDSDNVELKGLTSLNVDSQCLNPQLSTSEDVKLEQNPAYPVIELDKPTTEPLGKEDAAGETSDDVKLEDPA